jgi:hypothetical protein
VTEERNGEGHFFFCHVHHRTIVRHLCQHAGIGPREFIGPKTFGANGDALGKEVWPLDDYQWRSREVSRYCVVHELFAALPTSFFSPRPVIYHPCSVLLTSYFLTSCVCIVLAAMLVV